MPAHPDPTFHASAKLAMQAPPEKVAYTVMLSPDFSQPDALAVVDLDPGSESLGKIIHTVTMPNKGDGSPLSQRAYATMCRRNITRRLWPTTTRKRPSPPSPPGPLDEWWS
jgi:56kDa selenium binding protein (SBP56)